MRILLDECVNPRVKAVFSEHQVKTVVEMGWSGVTNGKLLALAERDFDVFLTLDQNLEYQQNTPQIKLGFLVVKVPDNKISSYEPIFPDMREAVGRIRLGQVIHLVSRD